MAKDKKQQTTDIIAEYKKELVARNSGILQELREKTQNKELPDKEREEAAQRTIQIFADWEEKLKHATEFVSFIEKLKDHKTPSQEDKQKLSDTLTNHSDVVKDVMALMPKTDLSEWVKYSQVVQKKQRGSQGPNNMTNPINILNNINKKKKPTLKDRKNVTRQFERINEELLKKNEQQNTKLESMKLFKELYERFSAEIDEAYNNTENKSPAFISLYQKISGKDVTTELETSLDMANSFAELLRDTEKRLATAAIMQNRARHRENKEKDTPVETTANQEETQPATTLETVIPTPAKTDEEKQPEAQPAVEMTISDLPVDDEPTNSDATPHNPEIEDEQKDEHTQKMEMLNNILVGVENYVAKKEQENDSIFEEEPEQEAKVEPAGNTEEENASNEQQSAEAAAIVTPLTSELNNDEQQDTGGVIEPEEEDTSSNQPSSIFSLNEDNNHNVYEEDVTVMTFPNVMLSDHETNKILKEVANSYTLDEYIASLDPKISEENIKLSLSLEGTTDSNGKNISAAQNKALALANPDDLLVVTDYSEKKGTTDSDNIYSVIIERLWRYDEKDINPNNAYALLSLADKIKDIDRAIYDNITQKIASALHIYDRDNLAASDKRLEDNYQRASEGLSKIDTKGLLDEYTFTDDKGNKIKDSFWNIKAKRQKEAIIALAKEMAAQELSQYPKDVYKNDEDDKVLFKKELKRQIDIILAPDPTNDDPKTFTQSQIAGKLGAAYVEKVSSYKKSYTTKI